MRGELEAKIRARCAKIGFPNVKADTKVAHLSGGEKARLLMGLASFNGPHLLILDEPTNHLDIDSRAALIEAINDYEGAVILVSHDRYLLDACADQLWLVDGGSVASFSGDLEDYKALVLGKAASDEPKARAEGAKPLPRRAKAAAPLKKRITALEERIEKFQALIARVDQALAEPDVFVTEPTTAAQLSRQRSELEQVLAASEDEWLQLSEQETQTG
jgi:ATP-binding cassette subfamily F protein 3